MISNQLADLISAHGYWIVAVVVALESMGIPAPGETALVTAAIFAGTTQRLNIAWVIVAAAIGAIVGDNVGYVIGRRFGHSMLLRYGHLVRIDMKRIKLGQYLFARHGGKVVFFGRVGVFGARFSGASPGQSRIGVRLATGARERRPPAVPPPSPKRSLRSVRTTVR
jgi:membrane protein DedA with SNARE-associated domain